jgi:hypothetical protein
VLWHRQRAGNSREPLRKARTCPDFADGRAFEIRALSRRNARRAFDGLLRGLPSVAFAASTAVFLSDVKGKNWLRSVTYAVSSFASSSLNDFTPKEARGRRHAAKTAQWVSDTDDILFYRTKPISPFEIKVRQQPKARNSRSTSSVIAGRRLQRRGTGGRP